MIDLWLVLARRKWNVIAITVLCLALGAGYAWMKPVVYEYRTGIELATIHGGPQSGGPVLPTSREGSLALLQQLIIPEQREMLFGEEKKGLNIEVAQPKDAFSLTLKTIAQPENFGKVKQLHQDVGDKLAERHAALLKERIEIMSKPFIVRASMLRDQLETLEEHLRLLSTRSNEGDGVRSLVDAQQMGDIRKETAAIRVELVAATSAAELIQEASQPTRIVYLAVESEQPVGKGKTTIAVLSLAMGIMAGVFFAFFSEFVSNARAMAAQKEQQESRTQ